MAEQQQCTLLERWRQEYKFFGYGAVDLFGTLIIAALFACYMKWSVWKTGVGAIILGVIVHYLLGIPTKLNYTLGLSDMPVRKLCTPQ